MDKRSFPSIALCEMMMTRRIMHSSEKYLSSARNSLSPVSSMTITLNWSNVWTNPIAFQSDASHHRSFHLL